MIRKSNGPCRELNVWPTGADGGPTARPTEDFAVAYRVTPTTAGYRVVGPAAFKLHGTILSLATKDGTLATTVKEFAARTGLSDRTVASALEELVDLGWVRVNATRGQGITVILQSPPAKLTATARERYNEKIAKAYECLLDKAKRTATVLAEDAGE